jgi:hypothetical protein
MRVISFSPSCQNRLHQIGDLLSGKIAIQTGRQQRIVLGMLMTNSRSYG